MTKLSFLKTVACAAILSVALTGCAKDSQTVKDAKGKMEQADVPMTSEQVLAAAIANPARAEKSARDSARHPQQTLEFFGIAPDMTILEIWPGAGYYADIVTEYQAKMGGTYIAAVYPETSERRIAANAKFGQNYPGAQLVAFGDSGSTMAPNSADMIITFRNTHSWMGGEWAEDAFGQFYAALKPGGTLGLVQHRLPATAEQDPRAPTGYIQQDYIIAIAKEAGFDLVDTSEVNANPKDTADYPGGVWTLPPRLRTPKDTTGYDKATYEAIGESDRMTLKFKKPN